ncbi:aldehyde dehydrogenase [Neorhizobium sp. T786]|uniref:aldehyde dehydrogenase n=1 Tax=Pseudorhizobium xiangyangii TaxID=2883104 RepID=UPI001CFF897F|nr:aldehyde dehydrogenase [Neorhizobium xiangyangii]MCB5203512.1 aldehyde dehydrogenase [Neorhizobium xiangyangii]
MNDAPGNRALADRIRIETRAWIDGQAVPAQSGKTFVTLNPATSALLAEVAACDHADVDRAVKAARRAFDDGAWSRCDPGKRKETLLRFAALLRQHGEELALLESLDSGKTIRDCRNEVAHEVPHFFQWYAETIDKSFGRVAPTGQGTVSMIVQEPIGVTGLIVPWNFPLLMAAWKLAPALATGCSVVLKPAEQSPLTALRLGELAAEAGIPAGVLNVVPGLGEEAGQAIGRHSDIDMVSFTGSGEVGAYLLGYAAQSNLKPVGLELGGKSPFLVLEQAAITDSLIESAVMAAFWNGGQNCSANMRQIVHRRHRDEFVARVIERVKAFVVGDPLDPATDIGAMITAEHRDRVEGFLQSGVSEGAQVLLGGASLDDNPGFFLKPTVFDAMTPDMKIAREEIFGPVLGMITVDSDEEALRLAVDTEFGLHASVFTQNISQALQFARALPVGTVSVNSFSEGSVATPFGGYRRSGSLSRDNGLEALAQYQQTKTIWIDLES